MTWVWHKNEELCNKKSLKLEEKNLILEQVISSRKFDTWQLDPREVISLKVRENVDSYKSIVSEVYRLHANKFGKFHALIGDKNNINLIHVDELNRIYPDAEYLLILRDPKDVYSSLKKLESLKEKSQYFPKIPKDVTEFIHDYRVKHEMALKKLEQKHIFFKVINYSRLIRNPQAELLDFFKKRGLAWEHEQLEFYKTSKKRNFEPSEFLTWKKSNLKPLGTQFEGMYQKWLSKDEATKIDYELKIIYENILGKS